MLDLKYIRQHPDVVRAGAAKKRIDCDVDRIEMASTRVSAGELEAAKEKVMQIAFPPEAEVGKEYEGEVVNITSFGAFVNILPGRDGLLHISKIGGNKRIDRVEDVLELGQEVQVVVEERKDATLYLVKAFVYFKGPSRITLELPKMLQIRPSE